MDPVASYDPYEEEFIVRTISEPHISALISAVFDLGRLMRIDAFMRLPENKAFFFDDDHAVLRQQIVCVETKIADLRSDMVQQYKIDVAKLSARMDEAISLARELYQRHLRVSQLYTRGIIRDTDGLHAHFLKSNKSLLGEPEPKSDS